MTDWTLAGGTPVKVTTGAYLDGELRIGQIALMEDGRPARVTSLATDQDGEFPKMEFVDPFDLARDELSEYMRLLTLWMEAKYGP